MARRAFPPCEDGCTQYRLPARCLDLALHHPAIVRQLGLHALSELIIFVARGLTILISISVYGCYTFIIEGKQLTALELPELQGEDLRTRVETLSDSDFLDTDLLEWLWDTISRSVLDALRLTKTLVSTWPRIWWIPTRLLA